MLTTALLAAAVVLAPPRTAQAQAAGGAGAATDDQKRERAGKHVEEGDSYKEKGQYEKAAREYEKAYALVPHPLLFFNLAQVYRLDGKREKALDYYEKYLVADPGGPAAAQAREFADKLRAELDAEARVRGKGHHHGTRRDAGRWMRIGGLATAGAGAIGIGFGIKYGLDARSASNQLSDHDTAWDKESLALEDKGPKAQRKMIIFSLLGAAAVVGGGVLYYYGLHARTEGPTVTPTGSEDSVGLAVGGTF